MFKGSIRFNNEYNIEITVGDSGEIAAINLVGGEPKQTEVVKKTTSKKTTKTEA